MPYGTYCKVLKVSAVHVYLTYPFVLSWSLLEAMFCNCTVISSKTAPLEEINYRSNRPVGFFDGEALVQEISSALFDKSLNSRDREERRRDVEKFSRENGVEGYMKIISGERLGNLKDLQ